MENQKKWAGWLIAALVVAVGVVAVVMSTGTAEPPAATQTPAVTASPMASVTPAPTASAAQSGMRTANASVLGYAGPVLVLSLIHIEMCIRDRASSSPRSIPPLLPPRVSASST